LLPLKDALIALEETTDTSFCARRKFRTYVNGLYVKDDFIDAAA
jgi:hypothetical protein